MDPSLPNWRPEMGFPFFVHEAVRGYEIDLFGHVNNAVYMNWLEHARWALYAAHGEGVGQDSAMVAVRHVTLDYTHDVRYGETVRLTITPVRVGETSFVLRQTVEIATSEDPARMGKTALSADVVMVAFHPKRGKQPLPAGWRTMLGADAKAADGTP